MRSIARNTLFLLVLILASATGCSDSSTSPDMVTLSGVVRNVDNGSFAEGVQIYLLDTEYRDDVATGNTDTFDVFAFVGCG